MFDETLSDIDRRNGIDPYDLGKLVHVRQHYRARSVMREGCRVVDKEVDRRAAQLLCKGVDGAFIRDIKSRHGADLESIIQGNSSQASGQEELDGDKPKLEIVRKNS